MMALTTERLILRPFCSEDAAPVLNALLDSDVARWIPLLPHPYGAAEAKAFVQMQTGPQRDALAVTHEGMLVGCMTTATELGYWFVKSAWGKGFATEAARGVVTSHFATGHETLQSGYMLSNDRSHRVLSKLGFVPTVTVERHSLMLGKNVAIQRMELTKSAWQARA